jgi:hypothetical protein
VSCLRRRGGGRHTQGELWREMKSLRIAMKTAVVINIVFFGISLLRVAAKETTTEWKQWSCDELTPNLCDLDVATGSFPICSIDVKYWRYKRRDPMPDTDPSKQISLPIVTLHGGPGFPHDYMLPLKQLACRSTSEIIFYDPAPP